MSAVEIVPRAEVDVTSEQRHCPECGSIFAVNPRWKPKRCPACQTKAVLDARQPQAPPSTNGTTFDYTVPLATDDAPPAPEPPDTSALDRELAAIRTCDAVLMPLDSMARIRVFAWLEGRFQL